MDNLCGPWHEGPDDLFLSSSDLDGQFASSRRSDGGIQVSRDEKELPDMEGSHLPRSLTQEAAQPRSVFVKRTSTTYHYLL